MNDGSIRIGTRIDTSGAKADLKALEKECEKTAKNIKSAGEQMNGVFSGMSPGQLNTALKSVSKDLDKVNAQISDLDKIIGKVQADTDEMLPLAVTDEQAQNLLAIEDIQIGDIVRKRDDLAAKAEQYRAQQQGITAEIARQKENQSEQNKEVDKATEKAKKLGDTGKNAGDRISRSFKRTGNEITRGINHGIRRIMRMSVAVLGVESAFTILRRAANTYMETNENLGNQIQGVWNILATAIGPVVETIVNWLTIAITYINAFVNALWGIDLVARANAAALKRQEKATKGAAAASKAAQTAGFDEMNKLQNASAGGAGGGVASGLFEPAEGIGIATEDAKRFLEIVKMIAPVVLGIALGIKAWGILSDIGMPLKVCAGVFLTIVGAVTAICGYIDAWINGVDWENFAMIIGGIAVAALGLVIAFGPTAAAVALLVGGIAALVLGLKELIQTGELTGPVFAIVESGLILIGGAIAILTGAWIPLLITAIGAAVVAIFNYGDEISAWLMHAWEVVGDFFDDIGDIIHNFFGDCGKWCEDNLCIIGTIFSLAFAIIGGVVETAVKFIGDCIQIILSIINAVVKTIQAIANGDWKSAWEAWKQVFADIWDAIVGVVKGVVNTVIDMINVLIRALNKIQIKIPDWVPGLGGKNFGINIREIPRLAKGGIVNNPGRGVPLIAGEAGREAILPLDTNTEWMDRLADKINGSGKIVIPIYLNGRKIAEEVIDLTNKRKFATNGAI